MSVEILYMKSENIVYFNKDNDIFLIEKFREQEKELKISQIGIKHSKQNVYIWNNH